MRKCVICGKEYNGRGQTCSHSCASKLAQQTRIKNGTMYNIKHLPSTKFREQICIICGEKFKTNHNFRKICYDCEKEREKRKEELNNRTCVECGKKLSTRARNPVCADCRNKEKECIICGNKYKGRGLTCCRSCTAKLHIRNQGSPFAKKEVQEKAKQTMIEKYGVSYAQMNEVIKDKTRQTDGAERTKYRSGNESKEYWIKTLGVNNPQKNKEIKAKTLKTREKFYNKEENYGIGVSSVNLKFRDILLEKTGLKFTLEKAVETNSYDLCYGNLLIDINPTISHNSTYGYAYATKRSQNNNPVPESFHFKRWEVAKNNGYEYIIVWDWLDIDKIVDLVKSKLGLINNRIYARKCETRPVSKIDANNFYNVNHIQGKCNGTHTGLYYNNELVSLMSWSKNELIRFANLRDTVVVGAYSKLFKCSKPNYEELISFSFNDYSNGNVYRNNGWELIGIVKPRYWWIKDNIVLNRRDCQKKNISKKFPEYYNYEDKSDKRTERELMIGLGFVQMFDSGKQKWRYINNN